MNTTGRIMDLKRRFNVPVVVIDSEGLGAGVVDRLKEQRHPPIAFRAGEKSNSNLYVNKKTEAYFKLQDLINRGFIKLLDDAEMTDQLMTIRFGYKSNGQRYIISKEEMKKDGLKSPDRADSLMMAIAQCESAKSMQEDLSHLPREQESEYNVLAH